MAKEVWELWAREPGERESDFIGSWPKRHWQFAEKEAQKLRNAGYKKVRLKLVEIVEEEDEEESDEG